jgi:hypothetical protein
MHTSSNIQNVKIYNQNVHAFAPTCVGPWTIFRELMVILAMLTLFFRIISKIARITISSLKMIQMDRNM